jgi:hypothetical protein
VATNDPTALPRYRTSLLAASVLLFLVSIGAITPDESKHTITVFGLQMGATWAKAILVLAFFYFAIAYITAMREVFQEQVTIPLSQVLKVKIDEALNRHVKTTMSTEDTRAALNGYKIARENRIDPGLKVPDNALVSLPSYWHRTWQVSGTITRGADGGKQEKFPTPNPYCIIHLRTLWFKCSHSAFLFDHIAPALAAVAAFIAWIASLLL